MDTIRMYIANLFQNLPKTPEVLKAKEELLSMMEDKYNELKAEGKSENEAIGIVISEFGNIDELKEELGIKSISENNGSDISSVNLKKEVPVRKVTMDETVAFLKNTYTFSIKIAVGVAFCITSAVPLIVLGGFLNENTAGAIGLTFMFMIIAIAVAIFIISGTQYEKYNYLKKEKLELDYSTAKYVKDLKENYKSTFAARIATGVILCIISVIPVILVGIIFGESNKVGVSLSVGGLLVIVATAVALFITTGMKMDSYKQLLQEEEYSIERKEGNELTGKVAAIYWPLITVIYLGWSFSSMEWEKSWIIWPIAGVLFAVVAGICNLIAPDKKHS